MPSSPQTDTSLNHNHRCRIVLTGGPGGGKTTAADLFRREIGEGVVIVPEAATMMFSGGFPRHQQQDSLQAVQRAIYHVQRNLEDIQATQYPERILLCDRGTIDGAAYWPGDSNLFFEEQDSSLEQELSRYDGVIFFESAAVGGLDIEGGNPARLRVYSTSGRARQKTLRTVVSAPELRHGASQQKLLSENLHRPRYARGDGHQPEKKHGPQPVAETHC